MKTLVVENRNLNMVCLCLVLAILTSSFDIVCVWNIGGFNFRICQLILLFVMAGAFIGALRSDTLYLSRRDVYLIIWVVLQFFFVFRSPDFKNAIGYFLWLLFDVATVFAIAYYLNRAYTFFWLIRVYLNSFVWIALLGLIQFALYPFEIDFFTTQYWSSSLARINGFSYEPSYYATYLLMGFVMHAYLVERDDSTYFSAKRLKVHLILITLAMVLSSSRMGWLMMVLWVVVRLALRWKNFIMRGLSRNTLLFLLIGIPVIVVILIIGGIVVIKKGIDFTFLLNGLGLLGMSSHSSSDRIEGLMTCIEIFKNDPLLGYSLGGVDPVIAQYKGIEYSTLYNGRAMSALGEVMVASGIIGIIPLVLYLKNLLFGASRTFFKSVMEKSVMHMALIWALCFELMILCFNQNILRMYLWVHIAVVVTSWKDNKMDSLE